jgi:hypothetical protein
MIFAAVGPAIYGPTIAASERQGAGLPAGPTQQPSVLTGLRVLAQMLGAEMVGPAADHPTRHAAIADDDATMTTADSTPTSPGTPCRRKRSSQPAACGQEGENLRSGSMSSVSSPSTECQGRDEDEDIVPAALCFPVHHWAVPRWDGLGTPSRPTIAALGARCAHISPMGWSCALPPRKRSHRSATVMAPPRPSWAATHRRLQAVSAQARAFRRKSTTAPLPPPRSRAAATTRALWCGRVDTTTPARYLPPRRRRRQQL